MKDGGLLFSLRSPTLLPLIIIVVDLEIIRRGQKYRPTFRQSTPLVTF